MLHNALIVAKILFSYNHTTWIVGGAVRDLLQGETPLDLDLCTTATPTQLMHIFDSYEDYGEYRFLIRPVGIKFGTVKLLGLTGHSHFEVDISTLRKDLQSDGRHAIVKYTTHIYEDLARRDFTINAMAIEIKNFDDTSNKFTSEMVIDMHNGIKDLKNHIIRTVGDPNQRFQEDYLRMIRACRFTGYGKGFIIEPKTWDAIRQNQDEVKKLTKERIAMEIMKIMKTVKPSKCLNAMKNVGLLKHVIPPLVNCIDVDQNQYHAESVYDHCIMACDAISQQQPYLRLATLLHDIGKPSTKQEDSKTGDVHFFNHEIKGASIAYSFMKEFKFPQNRIEYISLLVRHHMFRFTLQTKRKTIRRWLAKVKGHHYDIIELRKADRAGNMTKKDKPRITLMMQRLINEIRDIEITKEPLTIKSLDINGNDLIKMGYKPSPEFGKILNQLLRRVLDDPTLNQKDVLCQLAKETMDGFNTPSASNNGSNNSVI